MYAHTTISLSVDASPCHTLYVPLSQHHANIHASLTPLPCATQAPAVPTRLPRSITACTYKHHMHTHIRMHLYIDASPCQALYVPLNPTPCTHMCASLTHLPLCPHRPLLCLPHSIGACTHDYHMRIDIDMSLPIDASPTHALTHP